MLRNSDAEPKNKISGRRMENIQIIKNQIQLISISHNTHLLVAAGATNQVPGIHSGITFVKSANSSLYVYNCCRLVTSHLFKINSHNLLFILLGCWRLFG